MRLNWLRIIIMQGCLLFLATTSSAQGFSFNCSRDTLVPGCPTTLCITVKGIIPDIHGQTTSYSLNPGSFNPSCFPVYAPPDDPAGTPTNLMVDDTYSIPITLSFTFPFYGTNYTSLIASTNGFLSFDISKAGMFAHWQDNGDLTNGNPLYDRALIMGPYHDLDPEAGSFPPMRIQYQEFGTAPYRRWILSFFKVPLFSAPCNNLTENTHQIILFESTGIIEVKIFDKQICGSWNGGKAMVGIQNFARNSGMTAPNRAMSSPPWGFIGMNETWRFVPDAGPSLLKRVELYDMAGTLVSTGTTAPLLPGCLEASFPNVCAPAGATTSYEIRSIYEKIDDPAVEIIGRDTIRINRAQSLTGTANVTPASCGTPDGTITVTGVTGGTPPYEYSLDGVIWQSSNLFTGLAAGVYTVRIRDAGSVCLETLPPVTIGVSGNINETHTTTPTACFSANNGTITITSAGGTGPYTFVLDGGAPQAGTIPFTFTNVPAGAHTILVNDLGTGCNTGNIPVTVAVGTGVTGTATSTATACPGVNTGTITVTALTGTAPFTWSLDGGPFLAGTSPFTFTNVAGGTHNVTIMDNFNCSVLIPNINVPFGTGVTGSGTSTATSCTGVDDGTITVTALTGTAPFTWSLDGGPFVPGASPFTFNNVTAGLHNVTILDNAGCSVIVPVTVTGGTTPTATVTTTATACTGVNNGTITITSASMAGPYTFSLDGGTPVAGTIPFTFSNVAAGPHNVVVTGAGGCATGAIPADVTAGTGVTGNATTTTTSCPTATNGTITVTATTGTAPFTWSLDGGAPQSGASPFTFNNVASGNHSVLITDNLGCTLLIDPIVVAAGPNLTASAMGIATTCSGANNGSVIVTPTSGTAPYTYSLDGGPFQSGPAPYTFTNVAAGIHSVVVRDAAGCQTSPPIPVTVDDGPVLTTTVNKTDVLCNGGNTGTITVVQPANGLPPFGYSLDGINWQASNTFNGLAANTYTVYYRENGGCQGSQPVTINQPAILAGTQASTDATCNGQPDGTANITATGGVAPYEYSIDGGANWQTSNIFNGLAANNYTILVRDVNLCSVSISVTIQEPAELTASSVNTDASCNGGADGTITVTATGGNTGGYQYSIDGVNFQASNVFNVLPGSYTVTVRDNLGCTTTFTADVALGASITFTPMTDLTICEGSSTTLDFISNATSWSWSPTTGLNNPTLPNPVANPVTTTPYTVTATLGLCSTTETVIVNVNPAPVPDAGLPGFICYGQTYQLNASGGVQYSWSPSTYLDNPLFSNPVSDAKKTITYTLSILADVNGCPSLTTDTVTVNVTPPVKIHTFPSDTIVHPGDIVTFKAVSAVPSANIFTWTPPLNLSNPNIFNPDVTAMNIGDSIVYKVTASSAAGCTGEAYVRLRVYKGPELYVPTAFTPNGDGLNDRFYPFPVGIKSINYFRVYNRWGQMIFSSNTLLKGWDGKLQGVDQATGVYVWMAQGIDKNNQVITRQGTVTVIR